MDGISKETLQRLPGYLRLLRELERDGMLNVSSTVIAERLYVNSVQVRKDIAAVSKSAGKPKTGFVVKDLIADIAEFLGYNDTSEAILVGAGQLGRALLSYNNFKNYGLEIVSAFDINASIDAEVHGKPIFHISKLPDLIKRMGVHIGIITVPKESAQEVCDFMVKNGIRAIWNFAPVHLDVPSNIALKNEDMAASLALLSMKLQQILSDENK